MIIVANEYYQIRPDRDSSYTGWSKNLIGGSGNLRNVHCSIVRRLDMKRYKNTRRVREEYCHPLEMLDTWHNYGHGFGGVYGRQWCGNGNVITVRCWAPH